MTLFSGNCIVVRSVDHKFGVKGLYFNFYVSDVDAYLGSNWVTNKPHKVDQYRDGVLVVKSQTAVLWTTPNGGSVGNGHGRYESSSLAPKSGQWKVGDHFCLNRG